MRKSFFIGWLLLLSSILFSQSPCSLPKRPATADEQNLVYDFANVIEDGRERALNQSLEDFAMSSSNQILVLTVDTLCGLEAWEYATELGHAWGIGQAEKDNGVVLLVKPKKGRLSKGAVHIAVGYGLEGAIPDVYANRITDQLMIPLFKENRYTEAIEQGTQVIMDLAAGEYNETVARIQTEPEMPKEVYIFLLFTLLVFGLSLFGYHKRVKTYANVNKLAYWAAFWLLMNQHGHSGRFDDQWTRRHGRGYGGFGGFGGGGGFGGSGGGFGGFGGGGFGGGGAGGSW